jgi:transcriptional regulator with XRE-family HTH domain
MGKGDHEPKSSPLKFEPRAAPVRPHPLWRHIGRRLRLRRTQLGHGVDVVAKKVAISPETYEQYESGHTQTPAILLSDIAQFFELPVTWFFQDLSLDDAQEADGAEEQGVFAVATDEERVHTLAEYFRNLDLEGQQHLLLVARTLYKSRKGRNWPD